MTFAEALEQISAGDSSCSQVPSIDREREPAERRHPKAAYSRCRPIGDIHRDEIAAAKLTVAQGQPGSPAGVRVTSRGQGSPAGVITFQHPTKHATLARWLDR